MTAAAPQIEGVREVLTALKDLDPKLRRATGKQIRGAISPLQSSVRSLLPSLPLSGWTSGRYAYDQGAASAGVKARVGRGKKASSSSSLVGSGSSWPLISLEQRDAGGAVYDMAGRRSSGHTPQGRAFIAGLNRHAGASRSMWPGVEGKMDAVRREVLAAVDEAARLTNREIGRR